MQKKPSIKVSKFDLPIYGNKITFIYSNSYDKVIQYLIEDDIHEDTLKDLKARDYEGITFHVSDSENKGYYYLIVMKGKNKYEEVDTIAHEINHLVWLILPNRDIKLSKKNEEQYAYLTGFINKEFFKFKDGKI